MRTDRLLALQETDSSIDRLTARRRTLQEGGELAAARSRADAAEGALGEIGLRLDGLARDQTRFEHEIDSMTQKEKAEETRMYDGSVANVKELEAIRREIESIKKRRADREDELLALMERREELDIASTQARARSESLRAEVDEVAGASEAELAEIGAALDRATAERGSISREIDPDVLELYEDLRRQKKGIGAVALVDGVCQGCHEQLSAVELDRLKRTDGVRRCEHCRRILVF
jgi:uncharacterized protein